MSAAVRYWRGMVLSLAAMLAPAAAGQSEALEAAAALFGQQEYVAAQEALLKVDREALSEAERARLDELLRLVPAAIQGSERAAQDKAAADAAYEAGSWEEAERLYRAVQENRFARVVDRERAAMQIARIAEKRGLAEAARPEGTVEGAPAEPAEPVEPGEGPVEPAGAPPVGAAAVPPPAEPARLTPTDELRMRDELLWQRALAKSQSLSAEVREALGRHDYVAARKLLDTAVQTVEAARHYAEPVSKYQAARDALQQLRAELEESADRHAREEAARQQAEIAEQVRRRQQLYEQQKQEKIAQLFNSADQLRRERRFGEAAEVLREVLRIDPGNAKARYQLEVAEDYESFSGQAEARRSLSIQQRDALQNASEALIPWDVDVLYPKNWLELTAQRAAAGTGATAGADLEDVELNRKLQESLPEVRFEQQPFEQVVEFLVNLTKINVAVDWTDLEDNGIERDKPVTVRLANLSFKTVLAEVLAQVGGDVQLAYAVGDGLLRIATKEKLDKDKLVLIYDIRDLLVNIPQASRQAAFDVTQGLGGEGGGGGGGGGMFRQGQQDQQYGQGDQQGMGLAGQQLVEQIMDIIRQTVEPDSWRETGGGDASIRELNGQLIIYNTSDAHRQVADLLSQLRETRALQISVESRFLNVVSNFLEQFGVDLDFVFNSGSAGYDRATGATGLPVVDPFTGAPVLIDRRYSRIGSFATPPAFGTPLTPGTVPQQPYNQAAFVPPSGGVIPHINEMTPITAQQGSLSLVDPSGINTTVPGSFAQRSGLNPAMTIAGSFLDNLQVDFLIRATQANQRSSIVQAPRLVLFNGQASRITIGRVREYVSSLEPQLAEGAVGFEPEVEEAGSGVDMYVEGTISADRRYVTLTLIVQQRDEPTFERFEVQRASGSSPGAFIQLLDQAFTVLQTTVSVPDGGTVLLGGLKQVGEVELEAGVPILSKIPVLKRAFTNQTTVRDTRTLLILVKAKIIIQKEAEDEAFPTFTRAGA